MTVTDVVVVGAAVTLMAVLGWYFFGSKKAGLAELRGGRQEVTVTVKGGYDPAVIRVRRGVPLRIVFDRREASDCSARVVFPDFAVSKHLPAFGTTVVELTPEQAGEFGFACGMNMLHGTLVVEDGDAAAPSVPPAQADANAHTHEVARAVGVGPTLQVAEAQRVEFAIRGDGMSCMSCGLQLEATLRHVPGVESVAGNYGADRVTVTFDPDRVSVDEMRAVVGRSGFRVEERTEPGSPATEDTETAERRAEIRDLGRRVVLGAILTIPALYAVMAGEVFNLPVPEWMHNSWVQLALIAPAFGGVSSLLCKRFSLSLLVDLVR